MVIVLCGWAGSLVGSNQLVVRNISVEDGLSQSGVNVFFQDRSGFVWIGTGQGLDRHDGYGFKNYINDPNDMFSLPGEDIQGLFEDETGLIWVATYTQGLAILDPKTGKFEKIKTFPSKEKAGREEDVLIFFMEDDKRGSLWIGTSQGVFKINRTTRKIDHFQKSSGELAHDKVLSLLRDHAGNMWVGTEDGCSVFQVLKNQWEQVKFTLSESQAELNNAVKAIEEDSQGRIWLGTRDGVFVYQPGQGTLYHLQVRDPAERSLDSENLWDLAFDGRDYVWGATHDQGLMRWDIKTMQGTRFFVDATFARGLNTNAMRALFFDRTGLLWIGTRGQGVYIWNPDSEVFRSWQHYPNNPNSLSDSEIWYFAQNEPDSVWVSAFTGLNHVDFSTGNVQTYRQSAENPGGLTTDYIYDIAVEKETGYVLINGGDILDCLAPVTGDFEHFNWKPGIEKLGLPDSFSVSNLLSLKKDVLLFSMSDNLILWNYRTGEMRAVQLAPEFTFPDGPKSISGMRFAQNGQLWIGSNFGLFRVNDDLTNRVRFFPPDNDEHSIHLKMIDCLTSETDDRVWVGTRGEGVYCLEILEDKFKVLYHFTEKDGLASNMVFGILLDERGQVWASSMAGLSRIDTQKGWIKTFDYRDGLPGNEFNGGAYIKGPDGRLMFGGTSGFVSFFPGEFSNREKKTPAVFTRFSSTEIDLNQFDGSNQIELSYTDRVFRVTFAVLDYTMPMKNTFRTKLEGYEKEWTLPTNYNARTFTNLDAGDYSFLVQGINSDGVWDGSPLKMDIHIAIAPWLSIWAVSGYLLLFFCIIGIIWGLQYQKISERRANTRALKEREQRLTLALWGSGDTMWDWESENNTFMYTEINGSKTSVTTQSFTEYLNSMHPDDVAHVQRRWEKNLIGERESFSAEFRKKNSIGDWVWISQRGMIVQKDKDENVERIAGTLKDITASKQSENNLKLLASAFESTLEAMVITDQEWNVMRVNQAFTQITGFSAEQINEKSFHLLDSPDHDPSFFASMDEEIEKEGSWQGEIWMKNMFGRIFPTWRTTNMIRDTHGNRQYMTTVFLDISQHKKQESELRILANYDHLTGLPNRSLFHDRLQQALAHSKRNNLNMALCFLDLDRFKWINDSFGHKYGDMVLREVAERLKGLVREQDTVARLGGDEFIIILEDLKNSRNAGKIAATMVKELAKPMTLEGTEFIISTSLGIAMYPDDGTNAQSLITNSDAAMYFAKNEGRNNYQFYAHTMNTQVHAKLDLETRLRKAVKNNELIIYFQPRVCLKTLKPVGAEVLLRWDEPEKGIISPAEFIPVAEDTGLIVPIGEWVVERACKLVRENHELGLQPVKYSVNLSSRQFKDEKLAEMVLEKIHQYKVKPEWLEMEITEGTLMERTDRTQHILQNLKNIGLEISVDDFGTGYSSLSYLQRFPIDALKIDQSFVSECVKEGSRAIAIVKAIISMGHNLGLKLVAEGIETQEQLDLLTGLDCEEGQGYFFSRPLTHSDFIEYLKKNA